MVFTSKNKFDASAVQQFKANSSWYLLLGIGSVILGTLALIYSFKSTLISVLFIGILLVVMGIFEIVQSFKLSKWGSFFLHLFLGVLYVIGGFFIFSNPALNAFTLTLILAIFFIVSGILRMFFALVQHIPHKGWLFLNGLVTLILGLLIWNQWPVSGLWVIGTLMGIDAIFTGWTLIMLSLQSKKIKLNADNYTR